MSQLRIYNLTDVETPDLKARGLVNQTVVVGTGLVAPGESAEVEDAPHRRVAVQQLVDAGALAFDRLPPGYVAAKAQQPVKKAFVVAPPVEAAATAVLAPVAEELKESKAPKGKRDG